MRFSDLAVLPIPDGDVVGVVGGDKPGIGGVKLDLDDLAVGLAKRPQPKHLSPSLPCTDLTSISNKGKERQI